MAQQQYQMPPTSGRPYSPPSTVSSPGTPQGFPLPPSKRQRVSPDPRSQPSSPYVQSPYAMSPNTATTPSAGPLPHFSNISLPPNIYNTPYTNGHTTTPSLNIPPNPTPHNAYLHNPQAAANPQPHIHPTQPPAGNGFHPQHQTPNVIHNFQPQSTGAMGPPSKPVERDNVNDDQMDVLANAGVDLRAEESFALSFHTGSFNSQPTFSQPGVNATGQAFTQFTPGGSQSFYGAGPANQPGQPTDKASQDELQKQAADKAWADAALSLARSRQHELSNPHVGVNILWRMMDKIARENGLSLSTEGGKMPQFRLPSQFPADTRVQTVVGSQGAMTVTGGQFLPSDTALADQLALLSLATNLHVRTLLEDSFALARGRRTGSHGVVPQDWADVSAPSKLGASTVIDLDGVTSGQESAGSPGAAVQKRTSSGTSKLPTPTSNGVKTPTTAVTYTNEMVAALRGVADADREYEEARLLKRQNRSTVDATSRAGSVAPGTPGSIAPDPSTKPLTKKEREKQDKSKQTVDSHAQANATSQAFLFGSKGKKKYSWLSGGSGGGSGTSTPGRLNTQLSQGSAGTMAHAGPEKQMLTAENSKRWGQHREDRKDQPLLVEMRDLLTVLEIDGKETKALQEIYAWLDAPKSRKA